MDFDQSFAAFKQLVDDAFVTNSEGTRATKLDEARAVMNGMKPEERVVFWTKITCGLAVNDPENLRYAKMCHAAFADIVLAVFGVPMGEKGVRVVPKIPGLFKT